VLTTRAKHVNRALLHRMNRPAVKQSIRGTATSLWLVALLTAFVVVPVFLVEIPAMLDYPNHLARMYLLSAIGTPEQNPYYVVDWKLFPDLAIDLIVPAMARFMDIAAATKAFLVLSQILVVSGAVALEIAVKQRHQFAGFAAAMVLYSLPFSSGFLNFEFGTGIALWGIASWFALENWKLYTRLVVHSLFVFSLFVTHLFAFGLYCATIGFYELYCLCTQKFDLKKTAHVLTILIGPIVILLIYAILSNPEIGTGRTDWHAVSKLAIVYAWNGYSPGLSVFNVTVIFVFLYYLFKSHQLSLITQGKWIAAGFLILFIALPFRLIGSAFADVRFVIAPILILPAFLVFSPTSQIIRFLPPLVLSVIALLNAGYAATVWLAYRPEYAELKSSFALIERGAFVLISYSSDALGPLHHAPVLAVHYANAFVPSLFTAPYTPIKRQFALRERIRPDFADTRYYPPVPFSVLTAISNERALPGIPPYIACWMDDFDYLYLVGARIPNPIPGRLKAVAMGKRFTLFRIKKSLREGNMLCE
jgi:hypothetical protein